MAVDAGYVAYVLDQLSAFGNVTARKMFGGAGLYYRGLTFALIANDELYLKVDDTNRADYEAQGSQPFRPFEDKAVVMSYYQIPPGVLDDPDELKLWAHKAFAIAERAAEKKARRAPRQTAPKTPRKSKPRS